MAADSAPNDELGELRTKVAKLTEINRALMQRVEHGLDLHGNAYHLFQAAILLDRMVKDRTRELEQALEAVATSNRELNEAAVVSMTTQNRLQDAIDSISEGFAIFDPEDRLILFNRRFTDFWPGLGAEMRTGLTFQGLIRIAFERGCIAAPDGQSADAWIADRMRQRESTRRHGADRWVYAQSSGRWVQVNDRRSIEGGLASIYTDITDVKDEERQERERALAERSLHLQATLESMSIGVAVFDKDQRLVTANRQYGELLSLPAHLADARRRRCAASSASMICATCRSSARPRPSSPPMAARRRRSRSTAAGSRSRATRCPTAASSSPIRRSPTGARPRRRCTTARRASACSPTPCRP